MTTQEICLVCGKHVTAVWAEPSDHEPYIIDILGVCPKTEFPESPYHVVRHY